MTEKQFKEFYDTLHKTTWQNKLSGNKYYFHNVSQMCNDIVAYRILENKIDFYQGYMLSRWQIENIQDNFIKISDIKISIYYTNDKTFDVPLEDFRKREKNGK